MKFVCFSAKRQTSQATKHEIVCKIFPRISHKCWKDYILKDGIHTRRMKAAKKILRTMKRAHAKDKMEKEQSSTSVKAISPAT